MAAKLLLATDGANLTFGVVVVSSVVMQDAKCDTDADKAVARGEEGDKIGISIYGGQESEITGKYLRKESNDIGAIGDTLADIATTFGLTGDVVVTGIGQESGHDTFESGSFKAVNLEGASL